MSQSDRESGQIASGLRRILGAGRVLDRPIDRIAFSSDASFYSLVPRAVAQPATLDEVARLFAFSREQKIPLVFRAGGTSLSGQSITDGILVDVARYWRSATVEAGGLRIRVQPGVIGARANALLKPHHAKIGPDPASISVARLGGILSNNASGMCCGVSQNAYHTLASMKFMLPSGTLIDTAFPGADEELRAREPVLCATLLRLKERITSSSYLSKRIRSKYRMKNTTGYSLNAFLDFDAPAQIFSHLMIGAEGTLGFVAQAVLDTVPDLPLKSTGLLVFADVYRACEAIVPMRAAGAAALELMDNASLRSVENQPGMPKELSALSDREAALLVEFHAKNRFEDQLNRQIAEEVTARLDLRHAPRFTSDTDVQGQLWKVRKGLFPAVGAVRAKGTTVIIEDVAFPVERLADAATDLAALFRKHDYREAILFGHAKDGNLHFVIAQGFNTSQEVARYRAFIEEVVQLVVERYDGSLKAEHGTGRNMAPFVETEWGPEAYAIMRELKAVVDPDNLLNPGVIINQHADAHVRDLKQLPAVEAEVDKCIECGYCEPQCPSRDLTMTPRQRIVVRREWMRLHQAGATERAVLDSIQRDFTYMALDTCAVDGLCSVSCPVKIDTGAFTKRLRGESHSAISEKIARAMANHFGAVERGARAALGVGHLVQSVAGPGLMASMTRALDMAGNRAIGERFWQWSKEMPRPRLRRLLPQSPPNPEAILFPSCISRVMGAIPGERGPIGTVQAMLTLAQRAGVQVALPDGVVGNCCGVPFSSKGFDEANKVVLNRIFNNLFRWTNGGKIPVVVDTSPCTYGLKSARPQLTPDKQKVFDALRILDSIEFIADQILPRLTIHRKLNSVVLHPVCSVVKMGCSEKLLNIAKACSREAFVPLEAGCCGFAGDRGFLHPELTASATRAEAAEVNQTDHDGYFSSSRMCEVGMTRATGHIYSSYLQMLDFATAEEERPVG